METTIVGYIVYSEELEPASAPPVPNGDHGAGSMEESFAWNGRSRSCFAPEAPICLGTGF